MSNPCIKCNKCKKTVSSRNHIECRACSSVIHLKCNYLNYVDKQLIKNENPLWHCLSCNISLFPFAALNNYEIHNLFSNLPYHSISNDENQLVLHPPSNLTNLFNQFNDFYTDHNKDPDNQINCKYFEIDDLKEAKNTINKNSLSLFHINASSISKHFDEFEHLLQSTKIDFDVIAVSESRIIKDKNSSRNINLLNYSYESCPTESSAGGTLLYINDRVSYKTRSDLSLYKTKELESTFIEIVSKNKVNSIVGCIYRHPNMDLSEFNEDYISPLLEKLSKENKNIFLLGDFNIDLLQYNHHSPTNEFLDSLASNCILPHILQPTRFSNLSKTLIDNIFSNQIFPENISGNISATFSDHIPQFLIAQGIFSSPHAGNNNYFARDWSQFDQESFILSFFNMDWKNIINISRNDTNYSFKNFLDQFDNLLDKHAPYKKLSKSQIRFKQKPWITLGLQKSIKVKSKLFSKYIKLKDNTLKLEAQSRYKLHRNLLSTLLKQSKKKIFQ